MRLGSSSTCGYLSLVFLAFPWTAWGEETSEQRIPTWRVQATALNFSSGQSLGVYHRLNESWDWGLEIGADFSESETDRDRVDTLGDGSFGQDGSVSEQDSFLVNLDVDLRHWSKLREKLSWFWGPRLGGSYSNSQDTFRTEDLDDNFRQFVSEGESNGFGAAAGFIVGADLILLDGLSATFALNPVRLGYRWTDRDERSSETVDGIVQRTSETDEDLSSFEADIDLFPSLYLTLMID